MKTFCDSEPTTTILPLNCGSWVKCDSKEKQEKVKENYELMKKLITFCIENWDNRFMREIKEELQQQKEALESL